MRGAKNGTRTRDPDLGKVVLYQLSYFRISLIYFPALSPDSQGVFPFCVAKLQPFLILCKLFSHYFCCFLLHLF